jgi:hypothetical protein
MRKLLDNRRARLGTGALLAYLALWGAWRAGLWWGSGPGDHGRTGWLLLATLIATIACGLLIRHPAVLLLAFVPLVMAIGEEPSDGESAAFWVFAIFVAPSLAVLTVSLSFSAIVHAIRHRGMRPRPTRCPRCGRPVRAGAGRCRWCLLELRGSPLR